MPLVFFFSQIFVISQSEPRLPLQLEDAVRPDGEGEEVRMNTGIDGGFHSGFLVLEILVPRSFPKRSTGFVIILIEVQWLTVIVGHVSGVW